MVADMGPMNQPTILIVDDEHLIAMMVEAAFEEAGFSVQLAHSAKQAAATIDRLGPSLQALVTDVRLGAGADGWEVAHIARTALPHLPVVYMTGDSADAWSASGVPRSVLVQKPFVGAQVLAAVTGLMNQAHSD